MILAVPVPSPVTIPVADPMLAIAALLVLHVPPLGAADRVVVLPVQALSVPPILPGVAETVTCLTAAQPPLFV